MEQLILTDSWTIQFPDVWRFDSYISEQGDEAFERIKKFLEGNFIDRIVIDIFCSLSRPIERYGMIEYTYRLKSKDEMFSEQINHFVYSLKTIKWKCTM